MTKYRYYITQYWKNSGKLIGSKSSISKKYIDNLAAVQKSRPNRVVKTYKRKIK